MFSICNVSVCKSRRRDCLEGETLCNVRGNYFPEVLYAFLSEARDLYEEDGDELIVMDVTVL